MQKTVPNQPEYPRPLLKALDEIRGHLDRIQEGLAESFGNADRNRRLHDGLFAGSRDGIFILQSPDGKILQANAAAAKLIGHSSEQLATMGISDLHTPDHLDQAFEVFREISRTGGITSRQLELLRADGSLVPVSISAHVLSEGEGECVVAFVRDISDRVAQEKKLKELNEDLERRVTERTQQIHQSKLELEKAVLQAQLLEREARQANEVKSRFFASMTHELRTPLNAVIGMSELLLDMELGREQQETADIIASSARGLLGVINDILDFSKIEAGKLELDQTTFNLPELASGVLDTFTLQAKQKNLTLDLELGKNLPEFAIGDPVRLRQVLVNLVGNAIKFTDTGRVKIKIISEDGHSGSREIRFTVTDSGIGIPKDRQGELFEPFSQISAEGGPNRGGTGLGLSISRQLVERMNGMMGLQSKPGKGSTFWFTARVGEPTSGQLVEAKKKIETAELTAGGVQSDLAVLLVEDNPINQRVALGMLDKLGVAATAAADGGQALELLTEREFDLVFMDIIIPGLSGLEVTRRVRNEEAGPKNRHTPIIAMTAHATRQDRQLCLDAGMDDYLAKPVSTEKIRQAMVRALNPETDEAHVGDELALDQVVSALDGQAGQRASDAAAFRDEARRRLKVITGALYNCDFSFSTQECKVLADGARAINAEGVEALIGDLELAVSRRQQDRALALVEEVQNVLSAVPIPN